MPRTKYLLTRSANPAVTVANNASGCGGIATGRTTISGGAASTRSPRTTSSRRSTRRSRSRRSAARRSATRTSPRATASSGRTVTYAAVGQLHIDRRHRPHHGSGLVHGHRVAGGPRCVRHRGGRTRSRTTRRPTSRRPSRSRRRTRRSTSRPLADKTFGVDDGDFDVSATATSGLPVSFAAAGPCTITGKTVHITGVGDCTITASQGGNANFNAAPSVSRTFRRVDLRAASSARSTTAS